MSDGPFPVLILPDGVLLGRDNVISVTSEAVPTVAPAVPGASNYGDLLPIVTSPLLDKDYSHEILIQRAGGVYAQAEWVHKLPAESNYVGVDEVRYLSDPHDPFAPDGSTHPVASQVAITAALYASRIGKIYLFLIGGSTSTVYVRSRPIGSSDPNDWTLSTINLGAGMVKAVAPTGLEALEMPDGSLRLLVLSGTAGATDNDVNVFGTEDGSTWALVSRSVIARAYGSTINVLKFRAAQSGDWTRFVVVDATAPTLRTFVSSDRCASFTYMESADLTGADAPEVNGHAVDAYGHVDIEGVGDASGTFYLGFRSGSDVSLGIRIGARDSDWSEIAFGMTCIGDVFATAMVNDGTRLYVFCATKVPGVGNPIQIEAGFNALDDVGSGVSAYYFAPWAGYARYMPAYMVGCKADPGYLLMWGLVDTDSGGTSVASSSGLVYGRAWTTRSIWRNEPEEPTTNDFITVRWDSLLGLPNRAGASTPSVRHFGASGSETWLADRTRFDSTAAGSTGRQYYAYNEGATGSWLSNGLYAGWILGMISGPASVTNDGTAVRIRALGTLSAGIAGATFDVSVRHSTTQIVVYDNNASVALATLSASLAAKFLTVRCGFGVATGSAVTRMEIAVAGVNDVAGPTSWSSAVVTPTSAVGATFQGIEWGHLTGIAGTSSYWRRIEHDAVAGGTANRQFMFANPGYMRGSPCSAQPIYLDSGLYISWSGGSGFEGDTYAIEQRHTYEVENLFLPSPDAQWVGTSLATQTIVLRASESDPAVLFDHGGIGVFGTVTHRMTVEYNDANSWGSPAYSAALTNDVTPALRVSAATNHAVDVEGVTLDDGAYVGKYARNALVGLNVTSLRISRQVGNRLYLEPAGTANATRAFAAGSSLWIHDDKFVAVHPSRQKYAYMRLTFPAPPGTTTATLDVRAGTLIAGPTVEFPTELAWAHTEVEEPNVELSDGSNGLRWGYSLGRSRRGVEGTVRGDADKNRRKLAAQLRTLPQFSARPLVFAWDKDDPQRSSMLARFAGSIEHADVGWRQGDDGVWYAVGDLSVSFEEEL